MRGECPLRSKIIECALNHIAGNYITNQLKLGKSWSEAFGIGGSSHPVRWMGDRNGIKYTLEDGREYLITPREIKEYIFRDNQLTLF